MPVAFEEFCRFLTTPVARAVILLTLVLLLPFVAWYVLTCWRGHDQHTGTAADHAVNFREMYRRGVLADHEFRTIRTLLEERRRSAIKRDGETS